MTRPRDDTTTNRGGLPTDAGDGGSATAQPDNARAGAGSFGEARTAVPDVGETSTTVTSETGEPRTVVSMNDTGIDTTGADASAGDETAQSLKRAVGDAPPSPSPSRG
jgi:hypothetical protein